MVQKRHLGINNWYRMKKLLNLLMFMAIGFGINLFFSRIALTLRIPLYLDNVGTLLGAILGGSFPGAFIGYLTNIVNGIQDADTLYYGVVSIIIAMLATWFHHKKWFRSVGKTLLAILMFALVGGGLGSVLTWLLYGQGFGTGISAPLAHRIYDAGLHSIFLAQLSADLIIDLIDKTVVVLIVLIILKIIPQSFKERFDFAIWFQRPLDKEEKKKARKTTSRWISLRYKLMIVFSAVMIIIAVVTTWISLSLYHQETIESESKMGYGVANVVSRMLDPERIDEYLLVGEDAVDYALVEKNISNVLNSSPDIEYVYVYQIREDGCHVVFDPDTEDTPGDNPGEVIPFEEGFEEVLPDLLAGNMIEPVISNDSYGYLLSIYMPVYDSQGRCKCYVGVDISMAHLLEIERIFIVKVGSLFTGFFFLLLLIGLWLAEYSLIMPLNTMTIASSSFAFNDEDSRQEGLEALKKLEIRTGDELENLYQAITKTSGDMMKYLADVQEKNETISRMQNNLIMVLADMVESRDAYTGDHVKHTAEYCRITMEQMRREGIYADRITDEFFDDVVHSAPLHDIGKINVPDAILNKPGRLTEEEFARMKSHAMVGKEIISHAADAVAESSYLDEAQNLAAFHHEKWNGTGYPTGISGENIPLSARIMAVADVFDALVSKRSYKAGFSVEKAFSIIREGIGTHFDPYVASAFLHAEDEVRKIVDEQKKE